MGRFINGIGVGIFSVLVPLYIADISDARGRESLICYFQVMFCAGVAITYWMAYKYFEFTMPFEPISLSKFSKYCLIASFPALLCLLVPSTPLDKILADEEDTEGAENILRQLDMVSQEDVQTEAVRISKLAKAIKGPWVRYLLFICCV